MKTQITCAVPDSIQPTQERYCQSGRLASIQWLLLIACVLLLCGCGSKGKGGGYYQNDGPGSITVLDGKQLKDAVPRVDPLASGSNKPYTVKGKRYVPDTREIPYKKRGGASWYGKQFHGRKTSSGEVYDMYAMSAAHTTLPIPCYVRVTNVANNKSVIVRVNDRGPFHSSRIIDLSYAAAYKLDFIKQGTATVIVERIMPDDIRAGAIPATSSTSSTSSSSSSSNSSGSTTTSTAKPEPPKTDELSGGYYLQVAVFSTLNRAQSTANDIAQSLENIADLVNIQGDGGYYRVYVGPFSQEWSAQQAASDISDYFGEKPLILDRR